MKKINIVGVVGAGKMGSALAQKFATEGFKVILADQQEAFVEKGLASIKGVFAEALERRIYSSGQIDEFLGRIQTTVLLSDLAACDLVIEAIFEDLDAKLNLFADLDAIVSSDAILASNTSSFLIKDLAKNVSNPERFIGMHYFYHAAKNRLVEIIRGEHTSEETVQAMKLFAIGTGKDSIEVKDSYGFAVNRFFVPWLNEAVKLLEEGVASKEEIDKVCKHTFRIGMGPFALMNATGIPIAYHSEKTLEFYGPLYKASELLKVQSESQEEWNLDEATERETSSDASKKIAEHMLGTVFFVASQILAEDVCTASELDRGAKIGLRWGKGPVQMMRVCGESEVKRLVEAIGNKYGQDCPTIHRGDWDLDHVELSRKGTSAFITFVRPESMNVLNEKMVIQLDQTLEKALLDASVETIVLSGMGKAFVAGADIKFFLDNMKQHSVQNIVAFTKYVQDVFSRIANSSKEVVAILNGLTLGGGLELALCCDTIYAYPNAKLAFPETSIGIYPGLGGSTRAVKRLGKGLAKYLIYTGKMLSAQEALRIGLIDGIITPEQAFRLHADEYKLPETTSSNGKGTYYTMLSDYFEQNSVKQILDGTSTSEEMEQGELDILAGKVRQKAPIALGIVEALLNKSRGSAAELEQLEHVFNSSDALLGLSSIGKKVQFLGK